MKLAAYLVCDLLCLVAYLAVAQVSLKMRLPVPLAYAAICAGACCATWVGMVSTAFRAGFARYGIAVLLCAWLLFAVAEFARLRSGSLRREELVLGVAMLLGVALSTAGGLALRGFGRLAFQTAAVAVPISIALIALGARPLPEPLAQNYELAQPAHIGLPAPEWGNQ